MFILTLIAIKSSLTSKWAHMCSSEVIAVSLDSPSFSSGCSARISKRQKEGEGIRAFIALSAHDDHFSIQRHYCSNPNSEHVRK